jgi:hypothetical protein
MIQGVILAKVLTIILRLLFLSDIEKFETLQNVTKFPYAPHI